VLESHTDNRIMLWRLFLGVGILTKVYLKISRMKTGWFIMPTAAAQRKGVLLW
jgi:hypothetical protein